MNGAIFSRVRVTEILSEKMSALRARVACCAREEEEGANEGFKDNDNFVRASKTWQGRAALRLSVCAWE